MFNLFYSYFILLSLRPRPNYAHFYWAHVSLLQFTWQVYCSPTEAHNRLRPGFVFHRARPNAISLLAPSDWPSQVHKPCIVFLLQALSLNLDCTINLPWLPSRPQLQPSTPMHGLDCMRLLGTSLHDVVPSCSQRKASQPTNQATTSQVAKQIGYPPAWPVHGFFLYTLDAKASSLACPACMLVFSLLQQRPSSNFAVPMHTS